MKSIAPCKDCQSKHFRCHGSCEKYKEFLAEHEKVKKAMREYSQINSYQIGMRLKTERH